jgi:zinc protease
MSLPGFVRARTAALALAAGLALARPAEARLFDPQTFTLPNGLQVVVVPNHRVPIVTHMVWYKVGAADEVPGKSGLAHLLEHLMFKGTPTIPPGEFSKIVARHGGRDNAFTTADYTAYFQNVAVDQLDMVMRMEADRMHNLTLDEANVSTERAVVQEERRARIDNSPDSALAEQMQAALFLNSPYHRPVIGWESEIAGLSREDALAFYRRWYAPNNAILVVAGDVDAEQVRRLAETHYGPIPAAPDTPQRARTAEPKPVVARRLSLSDPRVSQPSWSRYYLAPGLRGDPSLAPALEVLAEALGGGTTSILYRRLAVEENLAAAADAAYDPAVVGDSTLRIGVVPRPGASLDTVEAAVEKELARVARDGIPAAEVERARTRLVASAAYARDSLHTGARILGEALAIGQSVAEVESWPERIAAVTPAQVAQAAAQVLDPKGSVTGLLLPEPGGSGHRAPAAAPAGPAKEIR